MFRTTVAFITRCNHPDCQEHHEEDSRLELEVCYRDKKHGIDLHIGMKSPSTLTVRQITKDALDFLYLDDIPPEQVRLVGFDPDNRYRSLDITDTKKNLEQLGITDDCILYFEPTSNASPPKLCQLTITGPDEVERVGFEWYRAKTTLGMLLKFVIENFSLQSVERERIHLFTIFRELDISSHSDKRLSLFDIHDGMTIHVQIIPPPPPRTVNENKHVRVRCTCDTSQFNLDVPCTETIADLKGKIAKRLEGRQMIDFILSSEANEEYYLDDSDRRLKDLGIKPGQTISATFRVINRTTEPSLVNNQNTTSTTSLSLTSNKPKFDRVTVICAFPSHNPETFQLPVTNTVNQLITNVETRKHTQRLDISEICSKDIKIDFKKDKQRCLADLGFKKDDIITVTLVDKSPTYTSIVSKKAPSSPKADKSAKVQSTKRMPIGLDNLGNSCYMNSALQCLAHVPQLTSFFMDGFRNAHLDDGDQTDNDYNPFDEIGEITGAYAYLLWYLWKCDENSNDYDSFKPTHLKERIGNKDLRFATDDQQDAQEFMTFFLDAIHEELKKKNQDKRNTIINDLFFGQLTSTITCTACNQEESSTHPISFLSIPLNRQERTFWINFISKTGKDGLISVDVPIDGRVENVIDEFTQTYKQSSLFYHILAMLPDGELDLKTPLSELPTDEFVFMEQEERLRDTRPARLQLPKKKSTLADCLAEFFSREELQDGWTCPKENCKLKTAATKQLKLSTLPNVLIIQFKRFSHENGFHQKVDTFVEYPLQGLDLNKCLPSLDEPAIYDLIAVSTHMGSISGGHYVAYARHSKGSQTEWYKFDDSAVSRVKSCDYEYDIVTKYAYLLFYIKRDMGVSV